MSPYSFSFQGSKQSCALSRGVLGGAGCWPPAAADEFTGIFVGLFVLFAAAKAAGELFTRMRQPPVVGEVLVGVLIGPHTLGLVGSPDGALIDLVGGGGE